MHGTSELGQMDSLAGDQFIYGQSPCFRGAEDRVVIRIHRLRNAKVHTALTHGLQITIKAFIPGKEQADYFSGGIINGTMQSVFGLAAKPFERCSVDLNELPGMGGRFRRWVRWRIFFFLGLSKPAFFSILEIAE